jgi:dipeptidyl aminopeptidase/acylaminoacyl peptidase
VELNSTGVFFCRAVEWRKTLFTAHRASSFARTGKIFPMKLDARFSLVPLSFCTVIAALALHASAASAQAAKPPITLDEFLNTTEIVGARIAPDGGAAVIGTESPDWKANTYRHTLWLWTATGPSAGLRALTQSGSDEDAQWSPDGKWIAFLSDRPISGADESSARDSASGDAKSARRGDPEQDKSTRLWLIPVSGGEAQPLYREDLDVHAFAWSPDSRTLYFSAAKPLTHAEQDANKEDWKDVIRWREQERGDLLLALPVAALSDATAQPIPHPAKEDDARLPLPAAARTLSTSKLEIAEIAPAPDGKSLAFLTTSISHRMENPADTEIFLVPAAGGEARAITHNQALEASLHWSPDGHWLHFVVRAASGALDGKYQDVQGRLYRMNLERMNPADGQAFPSIERLGTNFTGSLEEFEFLANGDLVALGVKGTEQQLYRIQGAEATRLPGQPGTYAGISAAKSGGDLLVRLSSINHPAQVYLAADGLHPDHLTALTELNPIFAQRAQPDWQPYSSKSPDGTTV